MLFTAGLYRSVVRRCLGGCQEAKCSDSPVGNPWVFYGAGKVTVWWYSVCGRLVSGFSWHRALGFPEWMGLEFGEE